MTGLSCSTDLFDVIITVAGYCAVVTVCRELMHPSCSNPSCSKSSHVAAANTFSPTSCTVVTPAANTEAHTAAGNFTPQTFTTRMSPMPGSSATGLQLRLAAVVLCIILSYIFFA